METVQTLKILNHNKKQKQHNQQQKTTEKKSFKVQNAIRK